MMVEKPSIVVLSAIAVAVIVLAAAGFYAPASGPANQYDRKAHAEINEDYVEKIATSSKDESVSTKSQNIVVMQSPTRKVWITDNYGVLNVAIINPETGWQIGQTASFPGRLIESSLVGNYISIVSETESQGGLKTEIRKIALATGSVTSYIAVPGRLLNVLQ